MFSIDDGTFDYKESSSEEVTLKGTYTGDPSKDGELKLSVTSGNWGDGWKAPNNDYGIYFEIEGDSFTGYDWYMGENGEEVKSNTGNTFTKVEEESGIPGGTIEGGSESGGDDTQDDHTYKNTWNDGGYVTFTLDSSKKTFTYKQYYGSDTLTKAEYGTVASNSDNNGYSYKLTTSYYCSHLNNVSNSSGRTKADGTVIYYSGSDYSKGEYYDYTGDEGVAVLLEQYSSDGVNYENGNWWGFFVTLNSNGTLYAQEFSWVESGYALDGYAKDTYMKQQ